MFRIIYFKVYEKDTVPASDGFINATLNAIDNVEIHKDKG